MGACLFTCAHVFQAATRVPETEPLSSPASVVSAGTVRKGGNPLALSPSSCLSNTTQSPKMVPPHIHCSSVLFHLVGNLIEHLIIKSRSPCLPSLLLSRASFSSTFLALSVTPRTLYIPEACLDRWEETLVSAASLLGLPHLFKR